MQEAKWYFDEILPGTKQRDSVSEEFFSNGTRLSAIIRESIQNSLDAWTNPGGEGQHPVRVRIYHSGEQGALPATDYAKYRLGAEERYASPKNGLKHPIPSEEEACQFITIEDFNTTGLTGRTDCEPVDDEDSQHGAEWNYFSFFFRENGTSKGQQKDTRGSWGAGKCVFQRASRLKTSFALSIRDGSRWNPSEFLVGMATLKIHRDTTLHTWAPDGWFGIKTETEQPNQIPKQPVSDAENLAAFKRDFNLKRQNEAGTSIVIPYLRLSEEDEGATYNQKNLIRAVLENFLVAIINGELEVEVQDGPMGIPVQLNAQTLSEHCGKLALPSDRSAIVTRLHYDMIAEALSDAFPQGGTFEAQSPGAKPDWTAGMFTPEQLSSMKKRLATKKPILINVPMPLLKKGDNSEIEQGHFRVVIQRADLEHPMPPVFFRLGLLVDAVRAPSTNYYIAAVIVEKGPVADMLVAAEPPSHNEWKQDADRLSNSYKFPKKHLMFVQLAARSILDAIDSSDREKSYEPLADVFGIPKEIEKPDDEKRKTKKKVDEGEGEDDTEQPKPPPPKQAFVLFTEIQGEKKGFKISSGPGLADAKSFPMFVSLKVGYDTFGGMDWSPFDFQLDDRKKIQIEKSVNSVSVEEATGNCLKIRVDSSEDFAVWVTGFDPNRDVVVDKIRYQYLTEEN